MPDWLTGQELLQRWQIKSFQLVEHVIIGLQPHDQFGKPKPSPDVIAKRQNLKRLEEELERATIPQTVWVDFEWKDGGYETEIATREYEPARYNLMEEEIHNLKNELADAPVSWQDYELPDDEEDMLPVFDDLNRSLFSVAEIEEYEKEKGLGTGGDLSAAPTYPSSTKTVSYEKSFILQGESWEVTFKGKKVHIRHRECLHYLINLLKNPDNEIHVFDLVKLVKGHVNDYLPDQNVTEINNYGADDNRADGYDYDELTIEKSFVDKLSYEDMHKFKEIGTTLLTELDAASKSNDAAMVTKKSDKFNKYKNHLLKEYGLTVRQIGTSVVIKQKFPKRSPELEKARKLAYKHITDAKKVIGRLIPSLEVYLNNHISSGEYCEYKSDLDEWHIES